MPSTTTKLEISGLGKQKMTALAAKAKRLGLSPARYVKQLVEDDLAIETRAQSMSLAQIMAPVRKEFRESGMTDEELDMIVNAARSRRRHGASVKNA
jgi:aspartate-semialdehyde dehydrogenase